MERTGRTDETDETKDNRKFEVQCDASSAGKLQVEAESLSVQIGQRILRKGAEEMWYSLAIYANEDKDGNLVIRVLVYNTDWNEPLQIAKISSRPNDASCGTALGCNLNHVKG